MRRFPVRASNGPEPVLWIAAICTLEPIGSSAKRLFARSSVDSGHQRGRHRAASRRGGRLALARTDRARLARLHWSPALFADLTTRPQDDGSGLFASTRSAWRDSSTPQKRWPRPAAAGRKRHAGSGSEEIRVGPFGGLKVSPQRTQRTQGLIRILGVLGVLSVVLSRDQISCRTIADGGSRWASSSSDPWRVRTGVASVERIEHDSRLKPPLGEAH
jgi:hypothetical protein